MLLKTSEAYLLMELVDGLPLDARPVNDLTQICDTFIQAASGLTTSRADGKGPG